MHPWRPSRKNDPITEFCPCTRKEQKNQLETQNGPKKKRPTKKKQVRNTQRTKKQKKKKRPETQA